MTDELVEELTEIKEEIASAGISARWESVLAQAITQLKADKSEIANISMYLAEEENKARELKAENERLLGEVKEADAGIKIQREQIEYLDSAQETLRKQNAELREEIDQMHRSRDWKGTPESRLIHTLIDRVMAGEDAKEAAADYGLEPWTLEGVAELRGELEEAREELDEASGNVSDNVNWRRDAQRKARRLEREIDTLQQQNAELREGLADLLDACEIQNFPGDEEDFALLRKYRQLLTPQPNLPSDVIQPSFRPSSPVVLTEEELRRCHEEGCEFSKEIMRRVRQMQQPKKEECPECGGEGVVGWVEDYGGGDVNIRTAPCSQGCKPPKCGGSDE